MVVKITVCVLLINSNHICLGTDSNITIDGTKTFTGVKKLHSLSNNLPMAIMNYGNADFGLVDFETIVGEFKKKFNVDKLANIRNVVETFIEFLKEFTYPENLEEYIEYYLESFKEYLNELFGEMDETDLKYFIKSIEDIDLLSFIDDLEIDFGDVIPDYVNDFDFINFKLQQLFCQYLQENGTGVVIAGFDKDCNRPSFANFNLIINNDGEIEWKCIDFKENFDGVSILTFAQDNEINAFIEGIYEDFEGDMMYYWRDSINEIVDDLFLSIFNSQDLNDDNLKKLKNHVYFFKTELDNYETRFSEKLNILKSENREYLKSIIQYLPKQDLADLARFLIMIPSSKRRFSLDLNSVGGVIDVCVMSKVEFNWVYHEKRI